MTAILEDLDLIDDESFNKQETEVAALFLAELNSLLKYAVAAIPNSKFDGSETLTATGVYDS